MITLRELAFEVVYQEIKSEFDVIFQKEKGSNVTDVDDGQGPPTAEDKPNYVLSQIEKDKALDDLRVKLDENLIGQYSAERHKIVDRFIEDHNNHIPAEVDYNLCLAFLNCLLDDSFINFDLTGGRGRNIDHPFDSFNPSKLLAVISQQSPDLQSLSLYFGIYGLDDDAIELLTESLVPALCTYLKTFKCLQSLSLNSIYGWDWHTKIDFRPFSTSLGELCPKLIRLDLAGLIPFDFERTLDLVLGKKRELLPEQLFNQ